jgi:hypothetical protein
MWKRSGNNPQPVTRLTDGGQACNPQPRANRRSQPAICIKEDEMTKLPDFEIQKKQKPLPEDHLTENLLSDRNPMYSEDGVDVSLIRWMLSITPTQRLQILQQNIRSIMRLREGKPSS